MDITKLGSKKPSATYDARVFTIPDLVEVENYFVWRQQDAERNSVTMLAQSHASHKQLMGKNRAAQHEIIHAAGDNWAKHPVLFKHGAVIRKYAEQTSKPIAGVSNWYVNTETPVFTKNREYLRSLVPLVWDDDLLLRKAASNGE